VNSALILCLGGHALKTPGCNESSHVRNESAPTNGSVCVEIDVFSLHSTFQRSFSIFDRVGVVTMPTYILSWF